MIAMRAVWSAPQAVVGNDDMLSTGEMCKRADVTFRQLDHWHRKGVFGAPGVVGSGMRRRWDPHAVARIRLLGRLSATFDGTDSHGSRGSTGVPAPVLRRVFESYDDGELFLAPGLWLRWNVENDTVED